MNVLPWTNAEFEQLKGRIYRQGQRAEKVTVVLPLTFASVNGERWSWCESKMRRLNSELSEAALIVNDKIEIATNPAAINKAWVPNPRDYEFKVDLSHADLTLTSLADLTLRQLLERFERP